MRTKQAPFSFKTETFFFNHYSTSGVRGISFRRPKPSKLQCLSVFCVPDDMTNNDVMTAIHRFNRKASQVIKFSVYHVHKGVFIFRIRFQSLRKLSRFFFKLCISKKNTTNVAKPHKRFKFLDFCEVGSKLIHKKYTQREMQA